MAGDPVAPGHRFRGPFALVNGTGVEDVRPVRKIVLLRPFREVADPPLVDHPVTVAPAGGGTSSGQLLGHLEHRAGRDVQAAEAWGDAGPQQLQTPQVIEGFGEDLPRPLRRGGALSEDGDQSCGAVQQDAMGFGGGGSGHGDAFLVVVAIR